MDIAHKSLASFILKSSATAVSGCFFGGCLYVNAVEVPARKSVASVNFQVDHFQATFPRALKYQGGSATAAALLGLAAFALEPHTKSSNYFLAASFTLLALWPWTLVAIMPTNQALMDGDEPRKKGELWLQQKLSKWSKVHAVRTAAGGVALAFCLCGLKFASG